MAISVRMNSFSHIYLLIMLFLISGRLFASATFIEEVCRQTHDQAFCTRVLGSDPRTRNAGLPELAQVAIDLASYSATGTKVKIHSLYLSEKNPNLRFRFGMCENYYADALDALRGAADYLKHADFHSVNIAAADVNNDGFYCEDSFKHRPAFRSPLTNGNNDLQRFAEIIAVISNLL
ncbi:hypothetical protein Pfo_011244 [Paulownia fortunei]|nr:hypothetical protein Pfo_011244 [Paulownia fortunei]